MKQLFYVVVFCLLKYNECADDLVVDLQNPKAKIRGHTLKTQKGKEYYAFQEVPYAKPPTRFKAAARSDPWTEILDTTKNTKICMQTLKTNPYNLTVTEDCLYMNIYIPRKPKQNGDLATLLWIHPGDFHEGAGVFQYYNPEYLMEYDVIVATFNYRLGPFGFLWMGDESMPGNLGLRDQISALFWLRDNIEAFGGDRFKIAFVGQGSGAAAAGYNYQYDRGTPFNCAILHSGNSFTPKWFQPDPIKYAMKFAKKFNPKFNSSTGDDFKKLFEKVPAATLLSIGDEIVKEEINEGVFDNLVWLPHVEGYMIYKPFLYYPMLEAWIDGAVRTVHTMIGYNSGEMTKWAAKQNLSQLGAEYDKDPNLLINSKITMKAKQRRIAGSELKTFYTNETFANDHSALIKYLNDQMVNPILKQAVNTTWFLYNYVYEFSYMSGEDSDAVPTGEELKYIWSNGEKLKTKNDLLVQKRLLSLWTNFIKYKDPTANDTQILNGLTWEPLKEFEHEVTSLKLGINPKFEANPRNFSEFDNLIDKYLERRLFVY